MIGIFVLTQAVIIPNEQVDKQEQGESESDASQQISKSAIVPTSTLQINLDYQSYLVTELFYQDDEDEKVPVVKTLLPASQKALKILFRRIISPNAP